MRIQIWRRFHGDSAADVIGLLPGRYRVLISDAVSGVTHEHPRTFDRLQAAEAAADDFLRRTFTHACTLDLCGQWTLWSA